LPRLVVVTYTRKAADEMRERTRRELVEAKLPPVVLGLFNEAFFGTIHSFCFELLRRFGPLAGLPTSFTVEPDDTALRLAFQRDTPDAAAFLPESARAAWRRYGTAAQVWPLVWTWPAGAERPPAPGPCPEIDLAEVLHFKRARKHKGAEENIRRSRERLREWQAAGADSRALGLPEASGGGEEFELVWAETFLPLREWLAAAAACAVGGLAENYARFKEQRGSLHYGDITRLALTLLRDPVLGERIRAQEFSILLDEAQDTDPTQFDVLLRVAQAAGDAEQKGEPLPAPGRFSMVGDPQQSIYRRGDVRYYENLRARLAQAGAAEELKFFVTMRCDEAIVAQVNEKFPSLLDGRRGQAQFVPLQARPGAGAGSVWRLPVARPENFVGKGNLDEQVRAEAAALARWLKNAGPEGTGADGWEEVAVLAPRRKWLGALAVALRAEGLRAQLHADDRAPGAEPARAWLGALVGVLADPGDDFEVIGVLREIFGVSDDEIFHWRKNDGVAAPKARAAAELLEKLAQAVSGRPLRDAVAWAAEAAQLRARLAEIGVRLAALEALLDQAAPAEARGDGVAAFARALRRGPAEAAEPVAKPGEIQLLTNHKAKGLEWPVVIQFGMFHKLRGPTPEYPRWVAPTAPGTPPTCWFDGLHAQARAGRGDAEETRAELQRLLYVAATRPRHTLILLDATELAEGKKPAGDSLAEALDMAPGGPGRDWWAAIPVAGEKITKAERVSLKKDVVVIAPAPWAPPEWGGEIFAAVAEAAGKFARRVRPSTLAKHGAAAGAERIEPDLSAPPDYPEEQAPPGAAVNYGNWWHGVMERTPWAAGKNAWAAAWEKSCANAPDAARGRAELARLLASPLAARLAEPGLEFMVETPFLWAEPAGARAFDGCVDLAAWDGKNSRWLVVDWKTDFVEGDYAAELRRRYGAQVGVYARALAGLTGAPAEAHLYGTRAGVLAAV
jgi:ATP-dependent exoDNAse (exonuclease V) beta subunit